MLFELPVPRFLQVSGKIGIISSKPGNLIQQDNDSSSLRQRLFKRGKRQRPSRRFPDLATREFGDFLTEMPTLGVIIKTFSRRQPLNSQKMISRTCRKFLNKRGFANTPTPTARNENTSITSPEFV